MNKRRLLIILISLGFVFLALTIFCIMMERSGNSVPEWLLSLGICGLIADVGYLSMQFKYAKWVKVLYALFFLVLGIYTLVGIAGTHEYWKILVSVVAIAYSITQFIKLIRDDSPEDSSMYNETSRP